MSADTNYSDDCQNSQEASGQKDHSHADSRARKTENARASAARTAIFDPAGKLAKILNEYQAANAYGGPFNGADMIIILQQNWFEVQAYAHAIHDSQQGETK